MTRNERKKANIAPPPASKAPCPTVRRARSLSPVPASSKATKAAPPKQTPKVPFSTQVAHQQATHGQGRGVNTVVAADALPKSTDPQPQSGSKTTNQVVPSPKQAKTKTFASVASTPKTPAKTQQTGLATQTPNKQVRAKQEVKKTSPVKGKQSPKKTPDQCKGKVDSNSFHSFSNRQIQEIGCFALQLVFEDVLFTLKWNASFSSLCSSADMASPHQLCPWWPMFTLCFRCKHFFLHQPTQI